MAWQFYGFMHPEFNRYTHGIKGGNIVCGPLPKKRWVKTTSDKRHKVKGRTSKATLTAKPRSSDSAMQGKAIDYARWLAARDGIALPDTGGASVYWSGVTDQNGRWDKRIVSVYFGAGSSRVTVNLPNWDFVPVMTECHDYQEEQMLIAA